jgi:hypothetical protein
MQEREKDLTLKMDLVNVTQKSTVQQAWPLALAGSEDGHPPPCPYHDPVHLCFTQTTYVVMNNQFFLLEDLNSGTC